MDDGGLFGEIVIVSNPQACLRAKILRIAAQSLFYIVSLYVPRCFILALAFQVLVLVGVLIYFL